MLPITPNPLAVGLAASDLPAAEVPWGATLQPGSGGVAPGDDIRFAPWGPQPGGAEANAGAAADAPDGGSITRSFMNAISQLVAQLGARLGNLFQSVAQPGSGSPALPRQNFFTSASASSVGDPHDAFSGTTRSGRAVSARWDSMQAHEDLLSSDSFAGGYRVSTTVTEPSASGPTQNRAVTVTADGGATSLTMNADGSYSAASFGRDLVPQTGVAEPFGSSGTLTLEADRSLTFDERAEGGGDVRTTLRPNGTGGVDVSSDAHDVDLGGYLVARSDHTFEPLPSGGEAGTGLDGFSDLPTAESTPQIRLA